MFRLLRLCLFVVFAFVAGILWGDTLRHDTCDSFGGVWTAGICIMSERPND